MGTNVYNIKGVLRHPHGQKWKALKRIGAGDILEGRDNIMREVFRITKLRRLPIPTATLINILTKSRGVCTREEWSKVFDKVSERVYRRVGIRLPRTLSIPYPASPNVDLRPLKDSVHNFIHQAPLPPLIRRYLVSCVHYVAKGGTRVTNLLCSSKFKHTWEWLEKERSRPCNCHKVKDIAKHHGCISTRDKKDWKTLFGHNSTILGQNIKNRLLIGTSELNKQVVKAALKLGKATNLCKTGVDMLTSELYERVQTIYKEASKIIPPHADPQKIDTAAREWKKRFIILPIDKNSGRPWVMCRCLFLNLLLEKFSDKNQFDLIHKYPTPKDAIDGTMDLLKNLARKHGLSEKFSFSPSKAPPPTRSSTQKTSRKKR